VPQIGRADQPSFAVDVIPVDWLASNLFALTSQREALAHVDASTLYTAPQIYHVTNPRPLRLEDLPQIIADLRPGSSQQQQQQQQQPGSSKAAGLVPLEEWLGSMETAEGEDAAGQLVRSAVIKQNLSTGSVMFSLDNARTMAVLDALNPGVVEACPAVDAEFLNGLWKRMQRQRAEEEGFDAA